MNLDNLKSGWQQYKVMSSFPAIQEEEILSVIQAKQVKPFWQLSRKIIQNVLIYSFLLLSVNGGCAG